jgi:ankyrin repeat protein
MNSSSVSLDDDFQKACSLVRHGKLSTLEELIHQPDWKVPIDYTDQWGNTLLHIAAQNGNKNMVKFCLRLGADINTVNGVGQSPLHFAFGYGYSELGEYLISKGADDSIRNRWGLTCYEGLCASDVDDL